MSQCSIIIVGAGGHGRVCADVARRAGRNVTAFCDPAFSHATDIHGIPVLREGERELFDNWPKATELFIAIGDNARRLSIASDAARHGIPLSVLIDPSAVISPSATLGQGVIAMPGVVINAEAFIGRAALINTSAIVEHGARVGQGAHIGPGSCLTGDASVGDRTFVGARATLLPGIQIGDDVSVGAGAVVTHDAGDRARLVGVPARPVHELRMIRPA